MAWPAYQSCILHAPPLGLRIGVMKENQFEDIGSNDRSLSKTSADSRLASGHVISLFSHFKAGIINTKTMITITDGSVHPHKGTGHAAVTGNEKADQEAKRARSSDYGPATMAYLRKKISDLHREENKPDKPSRWYIYAQYKGFPSLPTETISRRIQVSISQLRTGHALTGPYLKRIKRGDDKCHCLLHPIASRTHLLKHCPRFEQVRPTVWHYLSTAQILGDRSQIVALAKFIESTRVGLKPHTMVFQDRRRPGRRTLQDKSGPQPGAEAEDSEEREARRHDRLYDWAVE
ncbi:hypothetical protein EX30DRAFT_362997 [Ascodesmis nigricans]|uniref:Uncharacterized protein n=1 Tax=Ascodesmis nigricans TaxID=341454 RepID=A0A4S2N097_9PEZI|nr:hypothetical protein EX30DRAFT_362997 [Ascodesmis nigricans]